MGVHVMCSSDCMVGSVCCCPGSGASVLSSANAGCDLWLTGEMSHHELLEATHSGVSVILAEHSNSERGFLADKLKDRLVSLSGLENSFHE